MSNEHQEQGAKARNSKLFQTWATQLLMFRASEKSQVVAFRGITLYQIDAFATKPFEGNPAAVCLLNEWLPDEVMQSVWNRILRAYRKLNKLLNS